MLNDALNDKTFEKVFYNTCIFYRLVKIVNDLLQRCWHVIIMTSTQPHAGQDQTQLIVTTPTPVPFDQYMDSGFALRATIHQWRENKHRQRLLDSFRSCHGNATADRAVLLRAVARLRLNAQREHDIYAQQSYVLDHWRLRTVPRGIGCIFVPYSTLKGN